MINILTNEEQKVLELFVQNEIDEDFNIEQELKKIPNSDNILVKLINIGYINARISQGMQGNYEIAYDYTINGHRLNDDVLAYYNIKQQKGKRK